MAPTAPDPIHVLVVDPSPVLRPVLSNAIAGEADMQVCGQAGTAEEAFRVLLEADPHVAVVDISLEDAHGLDLVQNLQAQHPGVQVVVFSMYDERVYAERAVRAGAAGYVMKTEPTGRLMEAIRSVTQQNMYLSRRVSSLLLAQLAQSRRNGEQGSGEGGGLPLRFGIDTLTDREMDVLRLVGRGKTTSGVAAPLGLKERMVNVHQRRIRKKLALGSITELRQFATQWVMASQHVEEPGSEEEQGGKA